MSTLALTQGFRDVEKRTDFREQSERETFETASLRLRECWDALQSFLEDKTNEEVGQRAAILASDAAALFAEINEREGQGKATFNHGLALVVVKESTDVERFALAARLFEMSAPLLEETMDELHGALARANQAVALIRAAEITSDATSAARAVELLEGSIKTFTPWKDDAAVATGLAAAEATRKTGIVILARCRGRDLVREAGHLCATAQKVRTREAFEAAIERAQEARAAMVEGNSLAGIGRASCFRGIAEAEAAHALREPNRLVTAAAAFSDCMNSLSAGGLTGSDLYNDAAKNLANAHSMLRDVVAKFDSASENVLRTKEERRKAQLRDEVVDLSLEDAARVLGSSSDDEEEARIDRDPAAVATDVDAGGAFAGAAAALRSRLVPTLEDADLQELKSVLAEAQRNTPEDPAAFVRDVNAILEVHGLRLRREGTEEFGKLRMANGYIQIRATNGSGGGFKRAKIEIVQDAPRPGGNHKSLSEINVDRSPG